MKTTLQIPIDKNLKKTSETVAEEYGFSSLQELVRVFLTQMSAGKILPKFRVADEFLTSEEEVILTQKYLNAKEEKIHTAKSAKQVIEQLDEA